MSSCLTWNTGLLPLESRAFLGLQLANDRKWNFSAFIICELIPYNKSPFICPIVSLSPYSLMILVIFSYAYLPPIDLLWLTV